MSNKLTLIHTYYDEPELLKKQIARWNLFPTPIDVLIVDDASQKYPAYDILKNVSLKEGVRLSLYRVKEDIGFNSHGARNLAAKVAETEWLFFTDIDHFVGITALTHIVENMTLDKEKLYYFKWRVLRNYPVEECESVNQYIVHKDVFWKAGGYNESWTTIHVGDREFINKMRQFVTDHPLNMTLHDHRGARKIQYHDGDRIIYDNENGIMHHTKHRKEDITQITTKINFDWEQLL